MRKLASVQIIQKLTPINGADFIELAQILGWQCVVRRGEFKVGDKCIYFEIDSILDSENAHFKFMEQHGYRVKTIRLKGQLSQGLALPVAILPKGNYKEGDDCTEALKVKKYEVPDSLAVPNRIKGFASKSFPGFLRKTDEPRIQSCPEIINEMQGIRVYGAVKIDGTSISIYYNLKDNHFGVCSRNWEVRDPSIDPRNWYQKLIDRVKVFFKKRPSWFVTNDTYWDTVKALNIPEKLREYCIKHNRSLALQGECYGEGIQGNKLGIKGKNIKFFNVFDIREQRYLNFDEMVQVFKELGLEFVDVEFIRTFDWSDVTDLLECAKGVYPSSNYPREGLVIRPVIEQQSTVLKDRMSFKVINNDFLLKEK